MARCPRSRHSPGRSPRPSSRCPCTAPTWTTAPRSPRARTAASSTMRCGRHAPAAGRRRRRWTCWRRRSWPRRGRCARRSTKGPGSGWSSASSNSAVLPPPREWRTRRSTPMRRSCRATKSAVIPRPRSIERWRRFTRATWRAPPGGRDRCSQSPPTTPSAPPTCAPGSISWPSGPTSGWSASTAGGASTSPSRPPCAAAACLIRRRSITCSRRWWGSGPTSLRPWARWRSCESGSTDTCSRRHGKPSGAPAGPTPMPGSRPRSRRTSRRSSRRPGLPVCSTSSIAGSPASVARDGGPRPPAPSSI